MALKWYQQHLQDVVKENQALKFENQKKTDTQTAINNINHVFYTLFPEIPTASFHHKQSVASVLEYYQQAAIKWIEMMKAKLEILLKPPRPDLKSNTQPGTSSSTELPIPKNICAVCGNPKDEDTYATLLARIRQLQQQIEDLLEQQEKYLKQISYLRSTTKKLQFELAEQTIIFQKMQNLQRIEEEEYESQIEALHQEIQLWKNQYERMWQQKNNNNQNYGQHNHFEEERILFNSFLEENGNLDPDNPLWTVHNSSTEQSNAAQENPICIPSHPTTPRQ